MTVVSNEFYTNCTVYVCTDTYNILFYLLSANLDLMKEITYIKEGLLSNNPPVVNLNDDFEKEDNSLG